MNRINKFICDICFKEEIEDNKFFGTLSVPDSFEPVTIDKKHTLVFELCLEDGKKFIKNMGGELKETT